ncbi:terminase gpP N-terminus-related DNA-binding protein [Romboutsia sp.]|uniref:terminase gpP N-terminus-related DNA-binding protein n=1 Tax=Romboutsia sp. TaxID=1965302 RepID=UPI002CA29008|nr:hypothetical protein [Romboutsia sp.]HSQ90146.1 hypothetical protein [Romboutsia sp.]
MSNEVIQYDITSLTQVQQRFIHLYLTGQYKNNQLAQLLDIHENTIYSWLKREDVKGIISEFQKAEHEQVENNLKSMRMKAMARMGDLMDSPIDGVALQACKDVLDRTGHKAKQEVKVEKTVKTFEMQINELADKFIDISDFEVMDGE